MATDFLVPVDCSDTTNAVLAKACHFGKALNARISLLHVAAATADFGLVPPGGQTEIEGYGVGAKKMPAGIPSGDPHRDLKLELERCEAKIRRKQLEVTSRLLVGNPVSEILKEAERLKPEAIILGSHGHGAMYHVLMGSVSEGVLKEATCPVLMVPSKIFSTCPPE